MSAFAQTVQDANELYAQRGASAMNALKAAQAYTAVANEATDKVEKATMFNEASKYYFLRTSN